MIRIQVLKDGVETNGGVFANAQLAEEWYQENLTFFPEGHIKRLIPLTNTFLNDLDLDERRTIESEEALKLGEKLIIEIRKLNRKKLKLGIMSVTKFQELLQNPTAAAIERALWNGSFGTAKSLLLTMVQFYSED